MHMTSEINCTNDGIVISGNSFNDITINTNDTIRQEKYPLQCKPPVVDLIKISMTVQHRYNGISSKNSKPMITSLLSSEAAVIAKKCS